MALVLGTNYATPVTALSTPPRVRGLPFIGPTRILTDAVKFMDETRRHGSLVHARVFGMEMFLLYDADGAEQVLAKNQKNYRKDIFMQRAFRVFGNGLLRAEGDAWLKQRRLLQPGFHRQRVAGHAETMLELSNKAIAACTPGSEADFHQVMTLLTLEIAVRTMFGQPSDIRQEDAGPVGAHLANIMQRFEALGFVVEPDWWPSPSQLRYRRGVDALDVIIDRYIEIRRRAPANDVLSMLLEMRDEHGQPLSAKQVRDEVVTLFMAGHETTALNLTFAWRLLAMHPTVAASLRDELAAGPLSFERLMKSTLLDQVIKESLRLHPPAYAIPREAIGADVLLGCAIPPKAQVVIAVAAMHRDPERFPDPLAFKPERWTPEFDASLHRYAYFPFGGGPRMCIGAAFADLEAKIVLATFLSAFKPTLTSDAPLEVSSSLTQRPRHGLPVRLEAW